MSMYGHGTQDDGFGCLAFGFVILVVAGLIWVINADSVDPEDAVHALETYGFSEVEVVKYSSVAVNYKGCGKDDDTVYWAKATNPAGKKVDVIVCTSFYSKAATVRVQ